MVYVWLSLYSVVGVVGYVVGQVYRWTISDYLILKKGTLTSEFKLATVVVSAGFEL